MKSDRTVGSTISLGFSLEQEEDWPPVAVEWLPFRVANEGYVALIPPLFVKHLSVGDVIEVSLEGDDRVQSWLHVARSGRTTIWILRTQDSGTIDAVLTELEGLGCDTVRFPEAGTYSVDVPESVPIETVDSVLEHLDSDCVEVAFPSMRHAEQGQE